MNRPPASPPHARRLFFALWPSAADAARIMAWAQQAHQLWGGRVMRQDTLHLTLAFLGETPEEQVQRLCRAAPDWPAPVRPVTLTHCGCFRGPRVVWAGPDACDPQPLAWLHALHQDLWQRLQALGWQAPHEAFRPHVSLLRKAAPADTAALRRAPLTWAPEQCVLVASRPAQSGSYYEVLARMRLQALAP